MCAEYIRSQYRLKQYCIMTLRLLTMKSVKISHSHITSHKRIGPFMLVLFNFRTLKQSGRALWCQRKSENVYQNVATSGLWRVASYLSLEGYNFPVHSFEHSLALIDKPGLRGVAGLRAGGHGDQIVVIDVNATRQPVLVPLLFRAGAAPAGRPAQRSHRPRASVTLPPTFKQQSLSPMC